MKKINIDNILYNLTNTRAYILSEPTKNGLVLLANNTISFLVTKEEFARLNPQELGSEMPITFKKLHFKDEQIQSTYIRYPIVNKVATSYTNFLENLFKIYTTTSAIASESLHLSYNISKIKEEYIIRVLGIKGSLSFSDVFNHILEFEPFLWEQLYSNNKKDKEVSLLDKLSPLELQMAIRVNTLDSLVNPLIKAKILENYLKSSLLSLDNKLTVFANSLYVSFEVDMEKEIFKSLRSNRKVTRKSPKFHMPIEFNTTSIDTKLKESNYYNEIHKEVTLLSQYENFYKKELKKATLKLKEKDTNKILKTTINNKTLNRKKNVFKEDKNINKDNVKPKKLLKKKK